MEEQKIEEKLQEIDYRLAEIEGKLGIEHNEKKKPRFFGFSAREIVFLGIMIVVISYIVYFLA